MLDFSELASDYSSIFRGSSFSTHTLTFDMLFLTKGLFLGEIAGSAADAPVPGSRFPYFQGFR